MAHVKREQNNSLIKKTKENKNGRTIKFQIILTTNYLFITRSKLHLKKQPKSTKPKKNRKKKIFRMYFQINFITYFYDDNID